MTADGRSRPRSWWRDPLGALLEHRAPHVAVVVRAGSVTFRAAGRRVQWPGRLYVDDAGIIRGVGFPPERAGVREINVLEGSERAMEPLAKFVSQGIRHVLGRSLSIKPILHIDLEESSPDRQRYWVQVGASVLAMRVIFGDAGIMGQGRP